MERYLRFVAMDSIHRAYQTCYIVPIASTTVIYAEEIRVDRYAVPVNQDTIC
jgi:hypothetical protein